MDWGKAAVQVLGRLGWTEARAQALLGEFEEVPARLRRIEALLVGLANGRGGS